MNLKIWILFQKTFIFATKNGLWGKLLVFYDKKYNNSEFGLFQAFHSTKITTKTSNCRLIFCFQDRRLKFCKKAYLTILHLRLRGIFDIPTFLFFGIVYNPQPLIAFYGTMTNSTSSYISIWPLSSQQGGVILIYLVTKLFIHVYHLSCQALWLTWKPPCSHRHRWPMATCMGCLPHTC